MRSSALRVCIKAQVKGIQSPGCLEAVTLQALPSLGPLSLVSLHRLQLEIDGNLLSRFAQSFLLIPAALNISTFLKKKKKELI